MCREPEQAPGSQNELPKRPEPAPQCVLKPAPGVLRLAPGVLRLAQGVLRLTHPQIRLLTLSSG